MNRFENHDLVTNIYNTLRDHGVLKSDAPLASLSTEERRFLEEIDGCIDDHNTEVLQDAHMGYR